MATLETDCAEAAIVDIWLITHDYGLLRKYRAAGPLEGRFSHRGNGFGDRTTQLAVASIVGSVEHYAEQILLDAGCKPGAVTTWPNKQDSWTKAFSIDPLVACASFEAMLGFHEARNAILHRGGQLTTRQRKAEVYRLLSVSGIERIGFDVVVSPTTVEEAAHACVTCVRELDAARSGALSGWPSEKGNLRLA